MSPSFETRVALLNWCASATGASTPSISGYSLTPEQAFWLSTTGGAEALSLGDRIGRLEKGYEADLVVLDSRSTDIIRQRTDRAENLREELFALMILADERAVRATYAAGCRVHGT